MDCRSKKTVTVITFYKLLKNFGFDGVDLYNYYLILIENKTLMPWTCPKCERELRNHNQWHHCAKVSIDSLFEGKATELVFVFDRLLSEIIDWENVAVSATKNCIVFVRHQTFLIIRPMKKQLDIKFYSAEILTHDLVLKSTFYSGKFENHSRVTTLDELTPTIFNFIKKSYSLL